MSPAPAAAPWVLRSCACCGHRTRVVSREPTWALCPVCGWEDAGPDWPSQWNTRPLARAREAFEQLGASHEDLVGLVRPASPAEARPPWWLPIDEERLRLDDEVRRAFAGVDLAGGVSLREADRIDDHALPSRDERSAPPPGFGVQGPWERLEEAELAECPWGPFVFMDARGLRFYVPAFASFRLRHRRSPTTEPFLCGALVYQVEACRRLFDAPQRQATARWLFFLCLDDDAGLAPDGARALEAGWKRDLDPDRRRFLGEDA